MFYDREMVNVDHIILSLEQFLRQSYAIIQEQFCDHEMLLLLQISLLPNFKQAFPREILVFISCCVQKFFVIPFTLFSYTAPLTILALKLRVLLLEVVTIFQQIYSSTREAWVLRGSHTIYLYHLNIYRDSLPKLPRVLASQLSRQSIGRSNPEVVGSNPTEVKFSSTRGDSQLSFKLLLPTSYTQTR